MMDDGKNKLISSVDTIMKFCRLYFNNQKEMPIPPTQMALLLFISQNEEPCTPVMAAEFFKVKKPIVSKNVKALESEGLISKEPSMVDKRSYFLKLTVKGEKIIEENFMEFSCVMQTIQTGLGSEEFNQFILLVEKVNSILMNE